MDKNDIIEYVMHTPYNTNRAVLTSMLNQLAEGGDDGGGSWTVLTEESVTMEASGSGLYETSLEYGELITADSVRITLNGVEYICTNISEESGEGAYGAEIPDWSTYPFRLESSESPFGGVVNHITTETAGTYTVKIEAPQSGGSSDFSTAEVTVYDVSQGTLFSAIDVPAPGAPVIIHSCDIEAYTTYTVALYKGKAVGQIPPTITVSGNIEIIDENGDCIITGDCTIGIQGTPE